MVDIAVKNLTKFFVIGDNLLDGLTFEVQEGECVAILGRNGCGKTTLFNILTGQMDYDDGEVFVNPDKKLGLISQIPRFPAGYTVEDVLRSAYAGLMKVQREMMGLEQLATVYAEVLANVKQRDYIDSTRAESPLRQAPDALVLDNSHMSLAEQKQWILAQYQRVIAEQA